MMLQRFLYFFKFSSVSNSRLLSIKRNRLPKRYIFSKSFLLVPSSYYFKAIKKQIGHKRCWIRTQRYSNDLLGKSNERYYKFKKKQFSSRKLIASFRKALSNAILKLSLSAMTGFSAPLKQKLINSLFFMLLWRVLAQRAENKSILKVLFSEIKFADCVNNRLVVLVLIKMI